MSYCDGVMAACSVVYEMFSDVNVTVAGPPCASPAVHDSTRSFPEMLPAMAGPLEEVCALPRRLL